MSRTRELALLTDMRSVLLVFLAAPALAADWYVAPTGQDSNAGTSTAPFATIGAARTRSGTGDRILLARDGTYFAAGLDVGSGRTVTAWGTGAAPVLTASRPITLTGTWPQDARVRTAASSTKVLALYVDGRFVPLARWPNTGFLRIDNDDSPDRIVDTELASRPGVAAGRWTGAQVRWRRWSWWWETRPISAHSAVNTLDLGPDGRFQDPFSDPGSGYFIDDDLDELDAPGEWYWGNGTLYVMPPTWATASSTYEAVTATTGVTSGGTSFSDVQFQRFVGAALTLNRPATVERCTFAELETNAIAFTYDAQPFVIRGSTFRDVRNVAISGWANAAGATGSLVERNTFVRVGMERGYGGSGSWHAAAVIIGRANAATVQLNRFVDVGYAGVILGSDGQTVQRNVFVRTMGTLNDGAAVYTNCNASIIRENIVLDTIGDLETSHEWWPLGHGIWPEFLSDFHDTRIENNTIAGSNGLGIMLPNNFTSTVTGNVAVDNRTGGLGLSGNASDNQNHVISNNVLAAVLPSRRIVRPENLTHWWLPPYPAPTPIALSFEAGIDYGSMTNSTFIAPATGAHVIREGTNDYDTLAAWTAAAPSWASATGSSVVRKNALLVFNDTEAAADVVTPAGSWTLADGSAVGATVHLDPFRSVVLVTSAAVPVSPPYVAASGIDWRAVDPLGSAGGGSGSGGGSAGGTASAGGAAAGGSASAGGSTAGGSASAGGSVSAGGAAAGGSASAGGSTAGGSASAGGSVSATSGGSAAGGSALAGGSAGGTSSGDMIGGCGCAGTESLAPMLLALLALARRRR